MRKLIALLLALLLLGSCLPALAESTSLFTLRPDDPFARQFRDGSLRLEPATLPGAAEDLQWLSASPSGRFHLYLHEEDGLRLFDAQEERMRPVVFDLSGDAHGKLTRIIEKRYMLAGLDFVWSPDERYFTAACWDFVVSGRLSLDLLLGETTPAPDSDAVQVSVKQAWRSKFPEAGNGTVGGACFSPDSSKLYFVLHGNACESLFHDQDSLHNLATMVYDIPTGMIAPVAPNRWQETPDADFTAEREGIACLQDGSLVQLATPRRTTEAHLRCLIPSDAGWQTLLIPLNTAADHEVFHLLSHPAADYVLVASSAYVVYSGIGGIESTPVLTQVDAASLAVTRHVAGVNACISPDGRYYLTLSGDSVRWSLKAVDAATGETCPVDASALSHRLAFTYLAGHNSTTKRRFDAGMLWCGDLLILGTPDGPAAFRFAGLNAAD